MNAWWRGACIALVVAELGFNFSRYPLLEPDEGRNAEVMREMAASNDYLVPRLEGLPYIDKPVVYFAAGAVLMELLGPAPVAARLPSLLFTLATLAIVKWFARRRWGDEASWIAMLATATTPFVLAYSRTVIFDAALAFWVVAALIAFHELIETDERSPALRLAAWGSMALGVLTKGPIALALPLMVAVPYALWRRRPRRLVDATAAFLFLAIVLPWVFAVSTRVSGYFAYVLGTETFGRLTTGTLGRIGPWWYFLAILPVAALPWSIVAGWPLWGVRRTEYTRLLRRNPTLVFLGLWLVVPLLFFSLSQSTRPQYILPLMPALGLLVAAAFQDAAHHVPLRRGLRAAGAVLGGWGVALVVTRNRIGGWIDTTADVAGAIPLTAVALGTVCLLVGLAVWRIRRLRAAVLVLGIPVTAMPFVSGGLMDAIGRHRSSAALADAIQLALPPDGDVVAVEVLPLALPFYLNRTVTIVTQNGRELTSNYLVRHYDEWRHAPGAPFKPVDWWRDAAVTCERPRLFVIASGDRAAQVFLEGRLPLIADTGRYAAFGPCGAEPLALASR